MVADGGPIFGRSAAPRCARSFTSLSAARRFEFALLTHLALDPLTISDAHVALSAGGGAIQPGSDHAITFGGATSVNIPPGAELFSDPVALAVQPLSDLAISFYLPSQVMRAETYHSFADQDNFIATGDVAYRAGSARRDQNLLLVLSRRR